MERILYYGFAAVMGALIAFAIVVLYLYATHTVAGYAIIAVLLVVLGVALHNEFRIPNNKRAVGFVFILFVSAIISTISSLIALS